MRAQTQKPKGRLRMPKEKFVQDKYTSGEALYEYTFLRYFNYKIYNYFIESKAIVMKARYLTLPRFLEIWRTLKIQIPLKLLRNQLEKVPTMYIDRMSY